MKRALHGITPILRLVGASWTRWLLRNLDPMAPNYPHLLLRASKWEVSL